MKENETHSSAAGVQHSDNSNVYTNLHYWWQWFFKESFSSASSPNKGDGDRAEAVSVLCAVTAALNLVVFSVVMGLGSEPCRSWEEGRLPMVFLKQSHREH